MQVLGNTQDTFLKHVPQFSKCQEGNVIIAEVDNEAGKDGTVCPCHMSYVWEKNLNPHMSPKPIFSPKATWKLSWKYHASPLLQVVLRTTPQKVQTLL